MLDWNELAGGLLGLNIGLFIALILKIALDLDQREWEGEHYG